MREVNVSHMIPSFWNTMQDVIFRENSRNIKVHFCYFRWIITLPLTLTLTRNTRRLFIQKQIFTENNPRYFSCISQNSTGSYLSKFLVPDNLLPECMTHEQVSGTRFWYKFLGEIVSSESAKPWA